MAKILKFIFTMISILFLGLLYGWSVFVAPLEAEFGWERSDTSLTFTISIISMCSAIVLGGRFNNRKDKPFITLFISAILIFIGFFAVSRADTLMSFFVFYGGVCGFGCGFGYVEMISIPSKWFPKKQGLTSGALMMCIGLGAMILGTTCSALMSTYGWRTIFFGLGTLFATVLIVEGLILQSTVTGEDKKGIDDKHIISDEEEISLTTGEMLRTTEFKVFYIWLVVICSAGLALTGHIAPCALDIGAHASTAALIMGVVSVSNGLGRIFYGTLYDFLGVKKTVLLGAIVFLIASVIASIAVTSKSISLLFVGCILIGMSFGFAPISSSTIVRKFYGPKYFSSNFGVMGTLLFWGALIGPLLAGKLYTATGNYVGTFYCIIIFSVLAFILANVVLKLAKKEWSQGDKIIHI